MDTLKKAYDWVMDHKLVALCALAGAGALVYTMC